MGTCRGGGGMEGGREEASKTVSELNRPIRMCKTSSLNIVIHG